MGIFANLFSKHNTESNKPQKIIFTKQKVCEALNLAFDGDDETYTGLIYGKNSKPGCLAIVQRKKVSPFRLTPKKARESIADSAMSLGARRLLTTRKIKDYPCLIVPSPIIDSLTRIIHQEWKKIKPTTIEVTGSYGKTTVVSMLEAVLGLEHKVYGHGGDSRNMMIHCISRVQDWDSSYDVFLQEAAEAIHAGVPETMSRMIEPDICLVTNVGTSHIEYMGSQEAIFESCIGLQEGMSEDGILILNGDDPFLSQAATKRKTVYYGVDSESADYRAVDIQTDINGIHFDILHDGRKTPVTLHCVGEHNVQNAAGAFAVAKAMGMSDEMAAQGLARFEPSGYRQRLLFADKYHFYLDCYNASVESMKSALEGLSGVRLPERGHRIAVLSDIAQTGSHTEKFHKQVGRYAAESKLDILICHGEHAKLVAKEASKNPKLEVHIAQTLKEVEDILRDKVNPSDMILLKGSHSKELYRIPDDLVGTNFAQMH